MDAWKNKRAAKSLPTSTAALLIILLLVGGILVLQPSLLGLKQSTAPAGGGSGTSSVCSGGTYTAAIGYQCVTSATLTFALNDPLATGAIASATVTVYNPDGSGGSDSGSTSASGQYTTNGKYSTGQQIVAYITKTNYLSFYQVLTVPPVQITNNPPTNLQVPLFDITLGTYGNQITGNPGGTTFSTGQNYYFSEQSSAVTSLQLQWTLSETANNAGWVSSYNIFQHLTNHLVFDAGDGADGVQSITGYQYTVKSGTTTHYLWTVPDGVTPTFAPDGVSLKGWTVSSTGATQYYNSNANVATGGTYSFTFNINRNSESAGTQATWSFKLFYNADPAFSPSSYNLGPSATQLGSTFTIKFTA